MHFFKKIKLKTCGEKAQEENCLKWESKTKEVKRHTSSWEGALGVKELGKVVKTENEELQWGVQITDYSKVRKFYITVSPSSFMFLKLAQYFTKSGLYNKETN